MRAQRKHIVVAALLTSMSGRGAFGQAAQAAQAASDPAGALAARVQQVMDRPEFRHAFFGIALYSLGDGRMIWSHNADKLFAAASTTKLLTEGTALQLLGADYRFHTRV